MKLFEVFGVINLEDKHVLKSLDKVDAKGKEVNKSFGTMAKKVGKTALSYGAMAAAAGGALIGIAKKTSDALDRVDKLSQKVGMTTTTFQEWNFIMEQFGGSMENAVGDLAMFGERMMDAQNGVGEGAELFAELGINVEDTSGKLKSQGDIFEETIIKLQQMEDVTKRNAIASAMLGGTGEDLIPILNEQGSTIEDLKNKAHELGLVQSEEAVQGGVEFSKTLKQTTSMLKSIGVEIGTRLLPHLGSLLEWFNKNQEVIKVVVDGVFLAFKLVIQAIVAVIYALVTIFKTLYDIVNTVIEVFVSIYKLFENSVLTVFEKLTNIINNVIVAFKKVQTWFKQNIEDLVEKLSMPFVFAKEKIEAFIEKLKTAIDKFKEFLGLDEENNAIVGIGRTRQRTEEGLRSRRRNTRLVLDRQPTSESNNINVNMDVRDLDELNSWKDFQRRVGELQGAY